MHRKTVITNTAGAHTAAIHLDSVARAEQSLEIHTHVHRHFMLCCYTNTYCSILMFVSV